MRRTVLAWGSRRARRCFSTSRLLEAAGGLRRLGRTLAEDAAATGVIRGLGRRVTLTPLPFAQPIGRRAITQVWTRQLRWSRVRRDAFPVLFLFEVFNGGVLPIACAGLAVILSGAPAALGLGYAALWYLTEVLLARRAGWPLGWQGAVAMILRDLMMPVLWLATYARRGFEWRGSTLAPETAPDPA